MIDETGKRVWEETFDLWGKPHDHLETRVVGGAILTNVKPREEIHPEISQPFRFPGQYHDEETGLYYNRYRYYMPNEGMYTQRDPIGLAGGNPTVYGYVKNTLLQIDPFGLATLVELLSDHPDLLKEATEMFTNSPEWWGIDPNKTDVFYRDKTAVAAIRKLAGESGGHHPHGLALGGPPGQKLTHTGETLKIKNPTHSKVTGLQKRIINVIKPKPSTNTTQNINCS